MRYILFVIFPIFSSLTALAQTSDPGLPQTWEKDFIVTLSYSGSMDGSATRITITYDSCKYFKQSAMKAPGNGTYAMTETDRTEILKKLRALNVDKIKHEIKPVSVRDGHSSTLCFGSHCIEGGTSAEISNQDKEQFALAYEYIEDFATKHAVLKTKPKNLPKKKKKS